MEKLLDGPLADQRIIWSFKNFNSEHLDLLARKARTLQAEFGRGAFLVHFQSSQRVKIDDVFKYGAMKCWRPFIEKDNFIINDYILWIPIAYLDLLYPTRDDSPLRLYPLCAAYSVVFVRYHSNKGHAYVTCMAGISFKVNKSSSFESKLQKFAATITGYSSSTKKLTHFKAEFPILYQQLRSAKKIKQYVVDLRFLFWGVIVPPDDPKLLETDCSNFQKICNNLSFPRLYGANAIRIYVASLQWCVDMNELVIGAAEVYALWIKRMSDTTSYRSEWALQKCMRLFVQFHVLQRMNNKLYGSRCSHCNVVAKSTKKKHRFRICSGCKHRWYCSKRCQKAHWKKRHREHCHSFDVILANDIH